MGSCVVSVRQPANNCSLAGKWSHKCKTTWILEHRHTLDTAQTSALHLFSQPFAGSIATDFCPWGGPWRNHTKIWSDSSSTTISPCLVTLHTTFFGRGWIECADQFAHAVAAPYRGSSPGHQLSFVGYGSFGTKHAQLLPHGSSQRSVTVCVATAREQRWRKIHWRSSSCM